MSRKSIKQFFCRHKNYQRMAGTNVVKDHDVYSEVRKCRDCGLIFFGCSLSEAYEEHLKKVINK